MAFVAAVPAVAEATAGRAVAGQAAKKTAAKKAPAKPKAARRPPAPKAPPAPPDPLVEAPKQADALLSDLPGQIKTLGSDAANKVTLTPPKKLSAGDASGFAFGLIAYALFINYIRYGPAGVRGWIAAKFINKPLLQEPK